MTKNELRKKYLQSRNEVNPDAFVGIYQQICDNFFLKIDLTAVRLLHIYLPIQKKREPDTRIIIERLRLSGNIRICLPRINTAKQELDAILLEPESIFERHSWGMEEVLDGEKANPAAIDLVVVPLLAYDVAGHRVGYGRGFYDKFLARCRKDVIKVGLSAFGPEPSIDDLDSNDIPLNYCVTPGKVYSFISS